MKNNKIFLSIISFLFFSLSAIAQDYTDSKKFEGSYNVSGKPTLKLNVQFTEVDIEEWNKKEIQFTAVVEAKTSSQEATKNLMDVLELKHSQEGNTVILESGKFKNQNFRTTKGKSTFSFKIKLFVPKGTIYDATVKFGNLKTPFIEEKSKVLVEFGNLSANEVKSNVQLTVKFGGMIVNQIQDPKLLLEFANAKSMVKSIKGVSDITIKYSNVAVDISNITSGKIDAAFSKVYLVSDKNLSSGFQLVSKFGKFNNSTDMKFNKIEKDKFSQTEEYNFNESSSSKLNTKAEFSSVFLTNKYPDDSFYKSKDKGLSISYPDISLNIPKEDFFSTNDFKDLMASVTVETKKALQESKVQLEKSQAFILELQEKTKEATIKAIEESKKALQQSKEQLEKTKQQLQEKDKKEIEKALKELDQL